MIQMCKFIIIFALHMMDKSRLDYITVQAVNTKDIQYIIDKTMSKEASALYLEQGIGRVTLHDVVEVKPFRCNK